MAVRNILAQAVGLGGVYMLFSLYQQKDRPALLRRKRLADVLWGVHYLLLGAWAGAIPNLVGVARETVFLHDREKWARSRAWPAVFIAISWGLAIASWKSAYSLLPMCASTLVTVSLWCKSPRFTRILSVSVCAAFIVYDGFAGSWAGMLNESISLASIAIALFRNDYRPRDSADAR